MPIRNYSKSQQISLGWIQISIIAFLVIGVTIQVGLKVLNEFSNHDQIAGTAGERGVLASIEALTQITNFLPLLALVVVCAVLIGLVVMFRGGGRRDPI